MLVATKELFHDRLWKNSDLIMMFVHKVYENTNTRYFLTNIMGRDWAAVVECPCLNLPFQNNVFSGNVEHALEDLMAAVLSI